MQSGRIVQRGIALMAVMGVVLRGAAAVAQSLPTRGQTLPALRSLHLARTPAEPSGGRMERSPQGWVLGLDFGAMAVSFESDPGDGAALVGFRIGYGLDKNVTLYLGGAYADIESRGLEAFDNLTFEHVDLGVRLNLPGGRRRWVPYGDVAFTFWPVSDFLKNGERTTTDFTSMPTFSAGGGLVIYLSEAWALDVNVKAGEGTFKDIPVGNIAAGGTSRRLDTPLDLDATSARLSIGFSWWP